MLAVAVNVVEVVAAATVTEAGAGSAEALLDDSVTMLPPASAGWSKVTMHVVGAPEAMFVGLQASEDTDGLSATVTVAVVLPPRVAVNVTVWDDATDPAVAANVVELVVAGTVTDAGTGNAMALSDDSVTVVPTAGAG